MTTLTMNTSYCAVSNIPSLDHHSPSPDNEYSSPLIRYPNEIANFNEDVSTNLFSSNRTGIGNVFNNYQRQKEIVSTNFSDKKCAGCGDQIGDRFFLHSLDRFWHNSCLKCHCCGSLLAEIGSSCFTRRGLILCKKDYSSMFGCSGICTGCGETIPKSEMIVKALPSIQPLISKGVENKKSKQEPAVYVFHLKCFLCSKCGANLQPGDKYIMLGRNVLCEDDWQKLHKNVSTTNGTVLPTRKGKVGRPRRIKE